MWKFSSNKILSVLAIRLAATPGPGLTLTLQPDRNFPMSWSHCWHNTNHPASPLTHMNQTECSPYTPHAELLLYCTSKKKHLCTNINAFSLDFQTQYTAVWIELHCFPAFLMPEASSGSPWCPNCNIFTTVLDSKRI